MPDFELEDDLQPVEGEPEQKPEDPIAAMKAELESLRNEVRESREDTRYWREQATTGTRRGADPDPEPEEEEDPDINISDDIVDAVSSGDPKRFAKLIKESAKQLGFVNAKEARAMIAQTATDLARRETLYGKYPDLQDPKSELFQLTDKHYRRMSSRFGEGVEVIEEAAQRAALELGVSEEEASPRRRSRDYADDDYEMDRRRRVSSQAAPASRRGRSEGEDELDRHQSALVAKLQSIGAPITREAYIKRAKQGVSYSGLPSRRVR